MSIPPLVCSTPPPPDQCEDEKDPEDFDLHYNLSQEDDYDYGSFSTYNHFQSAISVNKPLSDPLTINNVNNDDTMGTVTNISNQETLKCSNITVETNLKDEQVQKIEVKLDNESEIDTNSKDIHKVNLKMENSLSHENNLHGNKKINNEEELNIEDLNLTVEEESLNSVVKYEQQYDNNADSDKSDHSDKDKSPHIPNITASIITSDLSETLPDEITTTPPSIDDTNDPPNSMDDLKMDDEIGTEDTDIKNEPETNTSFDMTDLVEAVQVPESFQEVINETDDEFGDFSNFHTTSDNKATTITSVIDNCDNPWENTRTESDFGAFEANFEEAQNIEPPLFEDFKSVERSAPDSSLDMADDDDDFGDFDDFKSSTKGIDNEDMQDPLSRVPVLDFQKSESESQILENINKILNTIFEEDIPEPESVFEGKLEAILCETWGHLLETDVRQPYIVNWNSSFGQKALLKALCIDSRNILFGPKWSYNMPKYAANLSGAPLQPQKQSTPSGQNQSEVSSDKHAAKTPGTWSDPFMSDGQESCNKESNATPKRPTDLDVFDTPPSTKSDKIYSSTLEVQPIRQINLPDTHIFTPTDSETPRSKTIHYNGPSVFLAQASVKSDRNPTEEKSLEAAIESKVLDDAVYSDFQDFKGSFHVDTLEAKLTGLSTDSVEPPANTSQAPSTSAYSIGLLQPIKIEPTMPTLNWPSPGEVKETFDDFSEFASSATWTSDIQETKISSLDSEKTLRINDTAIISDNSIKISEEPPSKINDSFDDDFDTFQSAGPSNESTQPVPPISDLSNFVASDFGQNITHVATYKEPELDFVFPKTDIKSEPISLIKSNDILNNSEPFKLQNNAAICVPKAKEVNAVAPAPSAVLQPSAAAPHTQQGSQQILQPLSLESFSQINWPNPGINLQDLSRFNPVETLNSLKSDLSVSGNSKGGSPAHSQKASSQNPLPEDDIWGEFVSSKPKPQQSLPKKAATFADDDEWTDFVSSPAVKPQNGLNTISLNVHTNLNVQKSTKQTKQHNQALEIPITHYITPKSSNLNSYNDRHFQNL